MVVNATNTSGVWSKHYRTLALDIQSPWWATWWARALYSLLIMLSGWGSLRYYINRIKVRQLIGMQQRELALQQQEARQLKAVNEMKTNFFANITHEFRTPLTLILGPVEQLRQRMDRADERRLLTTIDRNANQLLGLVNQLLDLSKLEAGAFPVVHVQGDLKQVMGQTVDSFREAAETKGIILAYTADGLASNYWFDADKLERILYNLLANALLFTDAGGQVGVHVEPVETGVRITVVDTGRGISAHQLPNIFDRFYQTETAQASSATAPKAGSGIGLSLVNELVKLQQGHIRVTSQESQGSTFIVQLPYQPAQPAAEQTLVAGYVPNGQAPSPPEADDERPLILLVKDNDELAHFILGSLPAIYRVQRTDNGQAGLEQARADLPDLIVSDVLMPVMDGYALCQHLKGDVRTSHIPIILLTVKITLNDRLEGLTRGPMST